MTISKKLYASFGAALAFTLILGFTAWSSLTRIANQIQVSTVTTHKLEMAGDLGALTDNMLSTERGMIVRTLLKNQEKVEEYNTQFADLAAKRKEILKQEEALATTEENRQLVQSILDSDEQRLQSHQELYGLAKIGDGAAAATLQSGPLLAMAKSSQTKVDALKQSAIGQVAEIAASNQATVTSSLYAVAVMVILSAVTGAVVIFLVRGISASLTQTVVELSEGADQIASASSQVSSSSQSLAQGASEQAASLEETSASSEEINSMAHKNTENAIQMAKLVGDSTTEFVNTNRQLAEMMTAMDEINESSGKIGKIIKIIDEIAFQTNILALNAAVEAARAGDAGMGFAVVADEVRSLAQRSAQAAKDTASLIEDSVVKAEAGKRRLGEVVGSIHRVSGEFNGLATLVDEVSHGSKEQSVGISQIGRALSQMERVTQSSAATAEETAAAAEELNAQSQSLQDLTRRLNQMVGSAAASGLSSGSSSIKRYPASVSGARQSMPRRLTGNPSFARARGGVENAQDGASFEAAFGSF